MNYRVKSNNERTITMQKNFIVIVEHAKIHTQTKKEKKVENSGFYKFQIGYIL